MSAGTDIMNGADEQSTADFKVRVKALEDCDEVIIRVDRPSGTGKPLYETIYLTTAEAHALLIGLMNEIG